MFIEILFTALLLVLVTAFYRYYLRPKREIKRLTKQFTDKGLKVFTFPYNPLDIPIFKMQLREGDEGDPFRSFKTRFVPYDLLIGNVFASPAIIPLTPAMRRQFAKNEIDYCYKKLPFFANALAMALGKGISFSEGNEWKRKRRICSSLFTYEYLHSNIPKMIKICQDSMDEIQKISVVSQNQGQKVYKFNLFQLTERIFSSIILTLFFGAQTLGETIQGQKVSHFLVKYVSQSNVRTNQTVPLLLGSEYVELGLTQVDRDLKRRNNLFKTWANNYIQNIIKKLDENKHENEKNLIQILIKSKNSVNGSQNQYSRQELIDQLTVFLFAGTDTTAHFVQMMIYFSSKHQEVLKKVREQVNGFKYEELAKPQHLKKLKFIEAIQKQTTRCYGPIPVNFPRVAAKDHKFYGVPIFKGTSFQYYAMSTHHDPNIYPDPLSFKPERWMQENKIIDSSYLTGFSMGARSCIGQALALLESKIAFYCFFNRYSQIEVPQNVEYRYKFMTEAQNLWVKVTKNR